MEAQTTKELGDNERDERARMTSVERAAKVVERDCKRAEKEAEEEARRVANAAERDRKRAEKAEEEAQRVAKAAQRDRKCAEKEAEEEAQCVAKAAERDAKWTAEVDASIESMLDGGVSFSKIASKLGNGLSKSVIYHRWNSHLKESSGITKPPVKAGRHRMSMHRL